jgi:hypothetical protein
VLSVKTRLPRVNDPTISEEPKAYIAQTANVTASGYQWDGVAINASFTIQ